MAAKQSIEFHGYSGTAIYGIWAGMKNRCLNEKDDGFKRYGARGIKVCQGWQESFKTFLADMGDRPSADLSIERRDNEGHYSCGHCSECKANGWPANCRWATRKEQGQNKRNNRLLEHDGRVATIAEWSRVTGLSPMLIAKRLASGWPICEALSPVLVSHKEPTDRKRRTFRNRVNNRPLTLNGRTMLMCEWAEVTGIPMKAIQRRIDRDGWSVERALTTPLPSRA